MASSYAVIGIAPEDGFDLAWQVVRLTDMAVAGYTHGIALDDGEGVGMPLRRTWATIEGARRFADSIGEPPGEDEQPVAWIAAGTAFKLVPAPGFGVTEP